MYLNGKRILISGGSRGIGRALCERFSEHGCKVAFIYRQNDVAANEVATATKALAIKADISDPKEALTAVEREIGRAHV